MEQLVLVLMVWASYLSGYPMPEKPPTIIEVPHSWFVDHDATCHQTDTDKKPCLTIGLYEYGIHVVHLDQGLSPHEKEWVLVHELVHYMQDLSGKWNGDVTCEGKKLREKQAYNAENKYMDFLYPGEHDHYVIPKSVCD